MSFVTDSKRSSTFRRLDSASRSKRQTRREAKIATRMVGPNEIFQSPNVSNDAFPPAAVVLTVSVRSVANRNK